MTPQEARFWSKVNKTEGCWNWTARLSASGYGHFELDGKTVRAHRFAYETTVGPIPAGLLLDHLCRNRACVRPRHLEPVTHRENVLRGASFSAINAAITHCPSGHPYDEENTYISATGRRDCRTCTRLRSRTRGKRTCPTCGVQQRHLVRHVERKHR